MPKSRARDKDVYAYRKARRAILATNDQCHLCGHGGADTIDHVLPISRGGTHDADNLRPAHGVNGCPTCGLKCNQVKGNKGHRLTAAAPPGCTRLPDSQRYLRMPDHGYWDTVCGFMVSQRWYGD